MKFKIFLLLFLSLFLLTGRVLAAPGACDVLLDNGDPTKRINFIFIAENFNDEQKFTNIAKRFVGLEGNREFTLLGYTPYSEFRNEYNIYSLYEAGKDYGCGGSDQGGPFVSGEGSFCFDQRAALE